MVINAHETWGSEFAESLARDMKLSFPDATGISVWNLKYMAKFAQAYPDREFVQMGSAQIPWSHNIAISAYRLNSATVGRCVRSGRPLVARAEWAETFKKSLGEYGKSLRIRRSLAKIF